MAASSEIEPAVVADEQAEGKVEVEASKDAVTEGTEAPTEGKEEQRRKKRDDKPPPKVDRPDREDYEEKKGDLDAQIEEVKTELDNLHTDIDIKKQEQAQMNDDAQKARSRAAVVRQQRDALLDEEDQIRDLMEAIEQKRGQQREYLSSLKKGLKFTKVEKLDDATAKIINKLSEGGLSIDTQSKLARSLQSLRSQRDSVSGYEAQMAIVCAEANATPDVRKQQEACQARGKGFRADENLARKAAKQCQRDARGVNSEINKLWSARKGAYDKKKKLLDSAYGMQREFNRQERAFERWNEYEKYLKRVEYRKERAERQAAEDKAWEESQEGGIVAVDDEEEAEEGAAPKKKKIPNPHAKSMLVLEELIFYTTGLLPRQDNAVAEQQEEAKVDVSDRNSQFKGKQVQALSPKVVVAEEGQMYGQDKLASKKQKPKRKHKKNKDDSKKSINHITDVFAKFHKVKMTTPLTVGQLPATLVALQAKLDEFSAWEPVEVVEVTEEEVEVTEEDEEPPTHVLEEEAATRRQSRRGSVQMADTEQLRRVQEQQDEEEEAAEESKRHRRNSTQMAVAMADAEQARRVSEHSHHDELHKQERAAAIAQATEHADEEQKRRVDESAPEPCTRAAAIAQATEHADEEQKRRVEESAPEPCTRKENVRRASLQADEEQMRRINEAIALKKATPKPTPIAAFAAEVAAAPKEEEDAISQQLEAAEQDRVAVAAAPTGPVFADVDVDKSGSVEFKSWDDDACLGKKLPSLSSLEYLTEAYAKAQTGKPSVLLLWGQYHKPGYKFLPLYSQLQAKYGSKVAFVGVSVDPSADYATKFLKDPAKKYSTVFTTEFAVAWDKKSALKIALTSVACLRGLSPPHAFVVDANGVIVWHQDHSELGATAPSYMGLMEEQLDAMLAGDALKSVGARPAEAYSDEEDEEEVDIELEGDGDFMDFL